MKYTVCITLLSAGLKVVPPQAPTFQPNLDAFEQMIGEDHLCAHQHPQQPHRRGLLCRDAHPHGRDPDRRAGRLATTSSSSAMSPTRISHSTARCGLSGGVLPHTLTCFSYSKSLSLPAGERLGYVAVRPGCEGEDVLVDMMAQISLHRPQLPAPASSSGP